MSYVDDNSIGEVESGSMVADTRVGEQATTTLEPEVGRGVAVGRHELT